MRVRIRGRDQRPEQEKHWSDKPREAPLTQTDASNEQPYEEGFEIIATSAMSEEPASPTPGPDVSGDPLTVADELYEDVPQV
ncbi:MAG: hypothetical protein ACRDYC_09185, partial [Acidimicrobiales bacterium]